MTAQDIIPLLAARHRKDLFVRECKTGPTIGTTHLRLDAWAMRRSYTRAATYGYEVKVSRSDFLSDDKWRSYLPYCNQFFWVAPRGLVLPDEISDGCGLLEVSNGGKRLLTRKKAKHREAPAVADVWEYILISRVRAVDDRIEPEAEYWKSWLERRGELKEVGWRVSKRLRQLIEEEITRVKQQNDALRNENRNLEQVREICAEVGIDLRGLWNVRGEVERSVARLNGSTLLTDVNRTMDGLLAVRKCILEHQGGPVDAARSG